MTTPAPPPSVAPKPVAWRYQRERIDYWRFSARPINIQGYYSQPLCLLIDVDKLLAEIASLRAINERLSGAAQAVWDTQGAFDQLIALRDALAAPSEHSNLPGLREARDIAAEFGGTTYERICAEIARLEQRP